MEYDNVRDRFSSGIDTGIVIDGVVTWDEERKCYAIVDDDGVAFSISEYLNEMKGKHIRFTSISSASKFELEGMLKGILT